MGLAIVHSIIEKAGGRVEVWSDDTSVGKTGTKISILLPRINEAAGPTVNFASSASGDH